MVLWLGGFSAETAACEITFVGELLKCRGLRIEALPWYSVASATDAPPCAKQLGYVLHIVGTELACLERKGTRGGT